MNCVNPECNNKVGYNRLYCSRECQGVFWPSMHAICKRWFPEQRADYPILKQSLDIMFDKFKTFKRVCIICRMTPRTITRIIHHTNYQRPLDIIEEIPEEDEF